MANQSLRNPPADWLSPSYDSTQQTYELFVPDDGVGAKLPLVLFISSTDKSRGWKSWSAVCRRYGILFAAPHEAGKNQAIARRIRVVLDVLDDVRKQHPVDPDRTYICGNADGAHVACRTGYMLPEYFGGILAIGGGEIPPKELWLRIAIADRLSIVFLEGSRDSERRSLFSKVFWSVPKFQGCRVEGRSYSGSPESMPDTTKLAASFQWLDADVARRRELATRFPSTRAGDDAAGPREERAKKWLADARKRLDQEKTRYRGLLQLEGVTQRWPDLAASREARAILDDYATRQDQPWRQRYLEDRENAFMAYESAYDQFYAYLHGHRRWRLPQPYSAYPEEHAEISWDEPPEQEATKATPHIAYDGATQVTLERLGRRVEFDVNGSVVTLDLSGTLGHPAAVDEAQGTAQGACVAACLGSIQHGNTRFRSEDSVRLAGYACAEP